jgi:hypothetical protein
VRAGAAPSLPGSASSSGNSADDPASFRDGYGRGDTTYYWDGDEYWVGYGDGYDDGYGDGHRDGHRHERHRHHPYHHWKHHDAHSWYFHYSSYYRSSPYAWYDYWYDPGWTWWDGFSLYYHDNHLGLFFRIGSGGHRYYCSPSAFYYRYPSHHRAHYYSSWLTGRGYRHGYTTYVPRFGHFGFWDYYPRTTIVYETYVPTVAPVERAEADPVDGTQIDQLVLDAEAAFASREYTQALALIERALALAPESGQLHLAHAIVLGAVEDLPRAADAIRRGVELSGEGDPLVADLRTLYADDALLAEHLDRLSSVVRADPTDDDARLVEAYFLLGADRAQAAKAAFDTLQARHPTDRILARLLESAAERVRLGLRGDEPGAPVGGGGAPATEPTGRPADRAPVPAGTDEDPFDREYEPPPPRWF